METALLFPDFKAKIKGAIFKKLALNVKEITKIIKTAPNCLYEYEYHEGGYFLRIAPF